MSKIRRLGPRWVLYTHHDNLLPFYSWGFEFFHHRSVATSRYGIELGVYLFLGPYRFSASLGKDRTR